MEKKTPKGEEMKLKAADKKQLAAHRPEVASLLEEMFEAFPKLKIRFKDDLWIYKFLNMFIPSTILYRMSTTLFNTIFISSRQKAWDNQDWYFRLLAHEMVHLYQFKNKFRIVMTYLAPQIWLLPLCIGCIFVLWTLGNVMFINLFLTVLAVFWTLFPWPSTWRLRAELDAYAMNFAIKFWKTGIITEKQIKSRLDIMTGWRYWKMGWNKEQVEGLIRDYVNQIRSNKHFEWTFSNIPAFYIAYRVLDKHELLSEESVFVRNLTAEWAKIINSATNKD